MRTNPQKKRQRNFYFFEKAWQQTFPSELSIKWRLADTSSPCPTKRFEAIRCYSAKENGYPDSFLKRLAYAGLDIYVKHVLPCHADPFRRDGDELEYERLDSAGGI